MDLGLAIERDLLERVADDVGVTLRFDYSGRFMFGRTCFGFVGDVHDLAAFFYALGLYLDPEDDGDALARRLRCDNVGLEMIYYFPGVDVTEPASDDDLGDPDAAYEAARDAAIEREDA